MSCSQETEHSKAYRNLMFLRLNFVIKKLYSEQTTENAMTIHNDLARTVISK